MTSTSRPARVVVVAFGPADATRAAHARARRLVAVDGDVVVVPAHRGVTGDGAVGTVALRRALPDDDRPVLVVHDDVHIGRDGVAALLRAWRATGKVVVPWMNAPGSSQYVADDVPADDGARARLARRRSLRGIAASTVRTACLLATGAQLRALADRFVTVAEGHLSDPSVATAVAGGALAHHAGRCHVPVVAPVDGPLLVAAMIVRDEAATLPDCLASLDGVVDRIEICDTGSVDDTLAIAAAAGANVSERAWRDDFAWARNAVLERCRDAAWILQIDADERLRCEDPHRLRGLLSRLVDNARACAVAIDNLADDGQVGSTHQGARVLRTAGLRYEGALHERACYDGTEPVAFTLPGVRLEHLGYRRRIVTDRRKGERNIGIAQAAYARAPGWETAFNLARSLSVESGHDARVAALLAETLTAGDVVPLTWRAWSLAWLGRHHLDAGDPEAAVAYAQEALDLVPADPVAGAVLADAAERLDRHDLVIAQRDARRATGSARPFIDIAAAAARVSGQEIASLLTFGETDEAYDEAVAAFRRDPDGFRAWPALVRSVAAAEDPQVDALLTDLVLADASGSCYAAVVRTLAPTRAVAICEAYLARGGADPTVLRDGLAAAIVSRDPALVAALLPAATLLPHDVARQLALAASNRGLDAAAQALGDEVDRRLVPFVVCGAGRSGTGYASRAFTALGHACGHEQVFDPWRHTPEFGTVQGDSSWLALPFLDDLPDEAVIFHQVRDPLEVLRSLMGIRMLAAPSPYLDFIGRHHPQVLDQPDELSRCMAYWLVWNREVASFEQGHRPYVRYRLEDLDAGVMAQLTELVGGRHTAQEVERLLATIPERVNARNRDESIDLAALPATQLTRDLLGLADALGYVVQPAQRRPGAQRP